MDVDATAVLPILIYSVDSRFSPEGLQASGMARRAIDAAGKDWRAVANIIEDTRMH